MIIEDSQLTRALGLNCGIYKIDNIVTGKCYIGSSKNISQRISYHKNNLKSGKHFNIKLQRAFNKYGENKFIFNILEVCDLQDLRKIEKGWISYFNSFKNGYNCTDETECHNKGKKLSKQTLLKRTGKPFKIVNPEGVIVEGIGASFLARTLGLNVSHFTEMVRGNLFSCQGWRSATPHTIGVAYSREHSNKLLSECTVRNFSLISPSGKVVHGSNVYKFARENGLDKSGLYQVLNGKIKQHRGWRSV